MQAYRLERLFPEELQERIARRPILVLPIGTIEWHSVHLPVGLDGIVAQAIAENIAARLSAVLSPVSYWAAGGVPFPFTLHLGGTVIEPVMRSVFKQFGDMGFKVIVAFTGHFGLEQTLALKRAAVTAMTESQVTILALTEYDVATDHGYLGDHAGKGETSLMLAHSPELVRLNALPRDGPLEGVIGDDPRHGASAEYGDQLSQLITNRTCEMVRQQLSPDAPTRRQLFIDALTAGVHVLERTAEERRMRPKQDVPPLLTPAYIEFCSAICQGAYDDARRAAERKLLDLSE